MDASQAFYEGAMRRAYRMMPVLAAAGALACLLAKGWIWALMFLAGAAASYLNFSWLHQVVNALGPEARRPPKRVLVFVALRYVLLGAGGYVIVRVFGMNALGALIGLFVPVAAVICEAVYELIHAGT